MKLLCVEDGSVDLDDIEEKGLKADKPLIYRSGSQKPFVLEVDIPEGTYKKMWEELCETFKAPLSYDYVSIKSLRESISNIQEKYTNEKVNF